MNEQTPQSQELPSTPSVDTSKLESPRTRYLIGTVLILVVIGLGWWVWRQVFVPTRIDNQSSITNANIVESPITHISASNMSAPNIGDIEIEKSGYKFISNTPFYDSDITPIFNLVYESDNGTQNLIVENFSLFFGKNSDLEPHNNTEGYFIFSPVFPSPFPISVNNTIYFQPHWVLPGSSCCSTEYPIYSFDPVLKILRQIDVIGVPKHHYVMVSPDSKYIATISVPLTSDAKLRLRPDSSEFPLKDISMGIDILGWVITPYDIKAKTVKKIIFDEGFPNIRKTCSETDTGEACYGDFRWLDGHTFEYALYDNFKFIKKAEISLP